VSDAAGDCRCAENKSRTKKLLFVTTLCALCLMVRIMPILNEAIIELITKNFKIILNDENTWK
jgi:hypothetical protein